MNASTPDRSIGEPTADLRIDDLAVLDEELEIDLDGRQVDLVMMELLRAHVPLSLLVDLASPNGPHSDEILAAETA